MKIEQNRNFLSPICGLISWIEENEIEDECKEKFIHEAKRAVSNLAQSEKYKGIEWRKIDE